MYIGNDVSIGSALGRLFKLSRLSVATESAQVDGGQPDRRLVEAPLTQDQSFQVWIEPISEKAKRQTLLKKRQLNDESLLIGRRGSIAELQPGDKDAYLISQMEPYTVSKRHCQLEVREDGVWLQDLDSRFGTYVDGTVLGGKSGQKEICLEPGEHELIPGPERSNFRFKITVEAA
ncbi:FHA domain-containing protein [Coraliomargarita parva]|uniref:FHA domain-containing protein n=1 Tax=Coraliomargarita parva TaxID=3014050 RepID=UPI0022B585EF|nr:FHA domain-containing protein [Coraliomargarita parva]